MFDKVAIAGAVTDEGGDDDVIIDDKVHGSAEIGWYVERLRFVN